MADYYPLRPGRLLAYKTRSPGGAGLWRLKVLRVAAASGRVQAECERTTQWAGEAESTQPASVVVDRDAVRVDGDVEYKFPIIPGIFWEEHPRRYEISRIGARAETEAGAFDGCLEVTYTIAGGDAGFGRRLYAPDVGFVYESCSDEADPYEIILTSISE